IVRSALTSRRLSGTIQSISERSFDYRTKLRARSRLQNAPSLSSVGRPGTRGRLARQQTSGRETPAGPRSPIPRVERGRFSSPWGRTDMRRHQRPGIDRRTLIKYSAASSAVLAAGVCSPAIAQARTIKLGHVSPQTGPLAAFAEADNFIIANFKDAIKAGLRIGSTTYAIDVLGRNSQSHPN